MRKLTLLALSVLMVSSLQAQGEYPWQGRVADVKMDETYNVPEFMRFYPDQAITAAEFFDFMKSSLQLRQGDSFEFEKMEEDQLGYKHLKFQLTHNGYPIEGGVFKAHTLNGKVESINGDLYRMTHNPTSVMEENAALQNALSHIGADVYKWEIPQEEAWLQNYRNNPSATYYPHGHLVYMMNKLGTTSDDFRLTYRFNVYAENPMSRQDVYVDAENGEVVFVHNLIHTIDQPGLAHTKYSGIVPIVADFDGNEYTLYETGRGAIVETYDMNMTTSYNLAIPFVDDDNYWDTLDIAQIVGGSDAHWGAELTYDYFNLVHGRNSFDGNGAPLTSYVNYSTGFQNAFWNGQVMTYGAGGGNSRPFSTLDVCGHEFTHGLTSNSSGLIYQDESGALNESFSDIFGAAIEFYGRPTYGNWLIGEEIGGIRSMSNPSAFQDPDTYHGSNWWYGAGDNGGVHTNSGVQNFWFYLMTEGGSGTNDNGDPYTVVALGIDKAAAIAFRNNTVYLNANSTYEDARFYAIQSAIDLYGECSNEMIQTFNAWAAVGVGQPFTGNLQADYITYDTSSCSFPFEVEFMNTSESGITYFWDFGDGSTSTDVSPTHVYTQQGIYDVKLIAYGCSTEVDSTTRVAQVTIDNTLPCNINIPLNDSVVLTACEGNLYDSGGGLDYLDNNFSKVTIAPAGGGPVTLNFLSFNYAPGDYIQIYDGPEDPNNLIGNFFGTNSPGTITSTTNQLLLIERTNNFNNREGFHATWSCIVANDEDLTTNTLEAWPNPFNDQVKVRYQSDAPAELQLEVMDVYGRVIFSQAQGTIDQIEQTLELGSLASGVYFLRLSGPQIEKTIKLKKQ